MKTLKQTTALILCLALICALLPQMTLTAHAEVYSGTCGMHGVEGDNLTWTLDTDLGILTIEGSGEMANYDYEGAPWYAECESIKTVILPDGLTSIGSQAFCECSKLTDVTIPDTVTVIGDYAFCNCELFDGTIPNSVTSISYCAFFYCSSLSNVSISETVTEIGEGAFGACGSLTEINVASGNPCYCSVQGVLFNKDRTELLQYPSGKTDSVYAIPEGVRTVANHAFDESYSLTTVTVPASVESLNDTFRASYNLQKIQVSPDNQHYCSLDGVLFSKDMTELLRYPRDKAAVSYTVPDGVLCIREAAVVNAYHLENLTISNSVTTIEDRAFEACFNLASVKLPESVQRIGQNAFYQTAYYENEENWNGRLLYLGNWLLAARSEILTADIREGTVGIADCAFRDCVSMTAVSIPDSVQMIGDGAFSSCRSLAAVSLGNGVTEIKHLAFNNCSALESIVIPDSVTSVGSEAFDGCASLKNVTLSNNMTSIGYKTFFQCTSLQSITIPESVSKIFASAFCGCSALEEVTIPEGVTLIGAEAFFNCPKLTSVRIPASVTEIYRYAFGFAWDDGGAFRVENFTIYGMKDTEAQVYAEEEGFDFVPLDRFTDVNESDFFFNPVMWALEKGVTGGVDETHFAPERTVMRADSMVFFWAAKGRPAFTATDKTFKDVKKKHWAYPAVMWAVEQGITGGTDAAGLYFSPARTCTRCEILQFLYAAMEKPQYTIANPYSDVKNKHWYKDGAIWAYENGLEKGENGKFNAKTPCTRGYVVTYLYRFMTGKELAE